MVALALVALISLISAGCGSNAPSETGTASSAGASSSTGTGGNKNTTDQGKAVKFAECIRAHGVPDFPDANAKGEFVYGVSVSAAVWTKAVDACKDLPATGLFELKAEPQAADGELRWQFHSRSQ